MLTPAAPGPSILVVGSINSDLVLRTPRLPLLGESLLAKAYSRVAGGKGANQAVAVTRLGARTTFVGRIGTDAEGETLKACLRAEGVCTDFLHTCSAPTGLAVITIDDKGQNSIVVVPGANNEVTEEDVHAALSADSYDAVLVQFEIPAETVIAVCSHAARRGVPVLIDAGPAQRFPLEKLRGITILTPNETETLSLTGIEPDTRQAAHAAANILLQRSGAHAVVIKLGERGALLYGSDGMCEHYPGYRVSSVDSTASGDAFTAAVTIEYVRTGDLRRAVMVGNAAGALATTRFGAQPSLPTTQALEEFCTSRGIAYAD